MIVTSGILIAIYCDRPIVLYCTVLFPIPVVAALVNIQTYPVDSRVLGFVYFSLAQKKTRRNLSEKFIGEGNNRVLGAKYGYH